jgi:hypothetical protein
LVFAAFLYSTVRDFDRARPSWPAIAALAGAVGYVAVTAVGIAAQQAIVEWGKAGADAKTTLGLYIFDSDSFPLSFEFGALFLAGIGVALLGAVGLLRLLAFGALAVAIILFLSGLIGAASPGSGLSQIGFLLFLLWDAHRGCLSRHSSDPEQPASLVSAPRQASSCSRPRTELFTVSGTRARSPLSSA